MNVLPEERDVTLVWTFTLPKPVIRVCGISSVNARRSSGEGLSWIRFASISVDTAALLSSFGLVIGTNAQRVVRLRSRERDSTRRPARQLGVGGPAGLGTQVPSTVKYSRTWVRYSVMRPSSTAVDVPSTSSRLMPRIV